MRSQKEMLGPLSGGGGAYRLAKKPTEIETAARCRKRRKRKGDEIVPGSDESNKDPSRAELYSGLYSEF